MKLVTSTGFGGTGSSAVTDILLELDCVTELSHYEYKFLHDPNGLGDLEDAINEGHRLKVDWAASKFLEMSKKNACDKKYKKVFGDEFLPATKNFIDRLFDIKWHGNWYARIDEIKSFSEKQRIKCAKGFFNATWTKNFPLYESENLFPNYKHFNETYYASDTVKFITEARRYTSELLAVLESRTKKDDNAYLFLDQLLPPINTKKYQRYFETPIKTFVVDKDPRDLFLTNNLFWGDRFDPSFDVDVFIKWYRATRCKARETRDNENTMFFMLDDLIFDYENVCEKIYNFLGIEKSQHTKKRQHFQSEKSRVNVGLYKKYSNYADEIARIEKELPEYLSPYAIESEKTYVTVEKPIKDIIEKCDKIQMGKKVCNRLSLAVYGTFLFLQFSNPKRCKNFVKNFCRAIFGILSFIPNVIVNLVVM